MRSFMVGTWNMGQLKNVYNILETEPQGNVKIMWVYTHIIFILPYIYQDNTAIGLHTV